ncbi:MAG: UDP-N-acetylmuramate--L-alanine ligase [Gemmatimonadota bacterium]|nr:UDP-N-acetylmuramate--L-alanine ligase [Gemmatimonadota bacterium]
MNAPDLIGLARSGSAHFVGMGGTGMCALAELVLRRGGRVSGCDLERSPAVRRLEGLGAEFEAGHAAQHVDGVGVLVVTAAVADDHPEVVRARELDIPVLKRAVALGSLVNRGRVVAVAGTHGKTTTSAIATEMLAQAGLDPTGFVGGTVVGWQGNLRPGGGDLYVVEADEYDRSFHALEADVAVITSVEADHLDVYGDLEGVEEGFRRFLDRVRRGGRIAVCADDHGASRLLAGTGAGGYSFGLSAGSQLRALDVHAGSSGTRFRVIEDGWPAGPFALRVPGLHNLRNALGAAAAARWLGVGWDAVGAGLAAYRGVERRFERVGEAAGVTVIDDYAHHPTEIRATLGAVRAIHPGRRLVAVFQPHLFTRTRDFHREFGAALTESDVVWLTSVFAAREEPIAGVTGELVASAARMAGAGEVHYEGALDELPAAVAGSLEPGDVVVTLGAGSIGEVGPALLELARSAGAPERHHA